MPIRPRDSHLDCDMQLLLEFLEIFQPSAIHIGKVLQGNPTEFMQDAFAETSTAKLLQVQSSHSMLVSKTVDGIAKYMTNSGESVNALLALDRVTGEATREALKRVWGMSLGHKAFEQHARVVRADKGSSNAKCERGVKSSDRK
eukprot:8285956-Pyramimonas_sp.AAC.1